LTRRECEDLISEVYKEFVPPEHRDGTVDSETRLFGAQSRLDSNGLVSLIVEVEQQLNDKYGTEIVIADDRAMSRNRSPFRTIGSLAEYVHELLSEQQKG